ncbi:MAG: HEPN domain-containing protein [Candidatus Omnitrophica bacterium]|nr:HEPN domain-containing protein [Candidatus Omnitrophota bacterium]
MSYEEFLREHIEKKLIKTEKIGFDQIDKVVGRAEKDLQVSERLLSIDEGHAYDAAYTAMLHCGRAFMFIKGFRPTTNFQHKTVVQFTSYFLGEKYKALADRFDMMRKNRNKFIYEPWKFNISATDAKSALKAARGFIDVVKELIKKESPQAHFKF